MAASSRPCRQLAAQLRWCGGAAGEALPLVVIVDMENSDGSIYKGDEPDLIERDELAGVAKVVYTGADSIEDIDPALLARAAGVLLRRCPFGAPQLAALPQLKSIVRMGAGYDNVDVPATQAAGVVASNCPDAWVEEVRGSAGTRLAREIFHPRIAIKCAPGRARTEPSLPGRRPRPRPAAGALPPHGPLSGLSRGV